MLKTPYIYTSFYSMVEHTRGYTSIQAAFTCQPARKMAVLVYDMDNDRVLVDTDTSVAELKMWATLRPVVFSVESRDALGNLFHVPQSTLAELIDEVYNNEIDDIQ